MDFCETLGSNFGSLAVRRVAVLALVKAWPVQIPESSEEWRHQAAVLKATTPVSMADAWIASLAILKRGKIVHQDPEFEHVPGLSMVKLPYK